MFLYYTNLKPETPALIYEKDIDRKCICTYGELYREITERAEQLKNSGKTCLGILTDGSFDCVIDIFAANKAGMQIVMLDPSVPVDTLKKMLQMTDVDMLYGESELKLALEDSLSSGVNEERKDRIIFFTSGTTSMSKAVTLSGYSLCQSAYNGGAKLPLSGNDILMCMLPLEHVFGFVCGLLWGLTSGAAVALGRGPRHYIDDLSYFQPTVLAAVPILLGFLIKQKLINVALKTVLVGAGDCPCAILDKAKQIGLKVSYGYGLTETSSGVAISVGDDPYAMDICPDDTITIAEDGEILVNAPTCIMQGYYKRQQETDEVLQNGILHTGDLGNLDCEGRLHITGRKKEILVMQDGTKIFLPEYESVVSWLLGTTDLAVTLKNNKPCLIYCGKADAKELWMKLKPMMETYPRSQQIADIIVTNLPIPKTAIGKIKRGSLAQLINEETTGGLKI